MDQETLKYWLVYDPLTGVFTRARDAGTRWKKGSVVGLVDYDGYWKLCLQGTLYRSHRLAWLYMTGAWPVGEVDHINRVRGDCRWSNLRDVNRRENCINSGLQSNNVSGVNGVYPYRNKWRAVINFSVGKQTVLGDFDSLDMAIQVRKEAEVKLQGV